MPYRAIDVASKIKAHGLLYSHWKPEAIAKKIYCSKSTMYNWENSIQTYGSINKPHIVPRGRPRALHVAAKESVLEYLRQHPWAYQDELAMFLEEEWGITVHKSTICRLLKADRMSRKKGQRIGHVQSQQLRTAWQAFMMDITTEQLIVLDESIFKQQSCWRGMVYGPIGEPARWTDDMRRGDTWSILPAYTTEGYLPCVGIKKGFFNGDDFLCWVTNELLPHCNPWPQPRSIIVLDNLNVHLNPRVRQVIEAKGCLLRFRQFDQVVEMESLLRMDFSGYIQISMVRGIRFGCQAFQCFLQSINARQVDLPLHLIYSLNLIDRIEKFWCVCDLRILRSKIQDRHLHTSTNRSDCM